MKLTGNILLTLLSLIIGYLLCEIAYKGWLYVKMSFYETGDIKVFDHMFYEFDDATGYRYKPGVSASGALVSQSGKTLYRYRGIMFDEKGRRTWEGRTKPDNPELRIAVLGDSFTAGFQTEIPWTGRLEEILRHP